MFSAPFRGIDHRRNKRKRAMKRGWNLPRYTMSKSKRLNTYSLKCLRLETDCRELALNAHSPSLQLHFLRMAQTWSALAIAEPGSPYAFTRATKRDLCSGPAQTMH